MDSLDKSIDNETERQKIKSEFFSGFLAEKFSTNRAQMAFLMFWVAWSMFALPLGMWWAAVLFDTTFGFGWQVANLPLSIKPWADQIFGSLFVSGASVAGLQTGAGLISRGLSIWGRRG